MALDERYHVEWKNISRYIRELFNYHCARCGKVCNTPSDRKDLLQVHHIDENPGNNHFENLIPLCAVCHLRIEKEARLHAPFENIQNELFPETYMTTMKTMREEGLRKFGGLHQPAVTEMSAEEFEREALERDLDY
ncbi:MAG: HNH endonuclease [SAR324 cluster bacterium]|nr:HNH endonuclease [SAR324 cluster bacterium]